MLCRDALLYLISTALMGLAYAFYFPLMSLFLVEGLGTTPLVMGCFLTTATGAGLLVSLYSAKRSDRVGGRKFLALLGLLSFAVATALAMFVRDIWMLLAVMVLIMSLSSNSLPQLFTLGRTYADTQLSHRAGLFISLMRATIAVAWVVGPPLAFYAKARFGFAGAFFLASITALAALLCVLPLPELATQDNSGGSEAERAVWQTPWFQRLPVLFFTLATLAMFSAMSMYGVTMPLYLTQTLSVDDQWVGNIMGFAAFVEVPVMIIVGMISGRANHWKLIMIGVVAGIGFFVGMTHVTSVMQLLALQLLNGIYVGITASLGIVFMQDLMKDRLGMATTLFTNGQQAAALIGTFAAGAIAQFFGYGMVFWGGLFLSVVTLVLLVIVRWVQRPVAVTLQTEASGAGL